MKTLNEAYKTLKDLNVKDLAKVQVDEITSARDLMFALVISNNFDLEKISEAISNISLGLYLKEQMLKEEVKVSEANEPMP